MIRHPTLGEINALNNATNEGKVACCEILRDHFISEALKGANSFEDLKEVMLAIHRPKRLGYLTPNEIEYIIKP